ncbi:MAG: S8 family serine peptidase [bacterium]|nr:S8 family serine peptidase [bacterium]
MLTTKNYTNPQIDQNNQSPDAPDADDSYLTWDGNGNVMAGFVFAPSADLVPGAMQEIRIRLRKTAEESRRLIVIAMLIMIVSGCTSTSVGRRRSLGLPIAPLVAASDPGRLVPNDYAPNRQMFDAVRMPEAWWYMAAFGGKYVSKTGTNPTLFPTVLVADDGFFVHADSQLDGSRFKGFGIYPDSAGRGSGASGDHGEHGTEVLSVVGSTKNNSQAIAGVAGLWRPSPGPHEVLVENYGLVENEKAKAVADGRWSFGSKFVVASITGGGFVIRPSPAPQAAAKAVSYWLAREPDLKVINLSQDYMNLADNKAGDLKVAFGKAEKAGVTIVIGAGNNGEVHSDRGSRGWLNGFSNIITVGALNDDGTQYLKKDIAHGPTIRSARGDEVDVFAPGVLFVMQKKGQGKAQVSYGSSFATPLVSGVVAMMYALNPDISPRMVRKILMATADDVEIGGRTVFRIDAYRALFVADNLKHPVYAPFRNP